MYNNWIALTLSHFGLAMLAVAIVLALLEWIVQLIRRKAKPAVIFYRWLAFFPLGITAIYAFAMHAFFPDLAAKTIGWQPSPFQFEVAIANLAIGVIAIFSFCASYGFRMATVIAATIWLWGDAAGHIYQMIVANNFTAGNAGSWFWMDIIIPLILITCIVKMKKKTTEPLAY